MDDFYGKNIVHFVGIVEHIIDDSYVRVRCLGIHPLDRTQVRTDQLPPALVTYPVTGGQVGGGSISHNIEVDSWVIGFFIDYPVCMQPIVTGVVQGSAYSMSTYASAGGEFVGQGSSSYMVGDTTSNIDIDTTAVTNIPGDSNIQKTYNYVYAKLEQEGYSRDLHLHTSALIGVLLLETSGIDPTVVGGWKGRAWGICQWLGSRREQLFARYGQTKRLDHQLDFMWWELNNTYRSAKNLWLSSTNMDDAVAGFASFERAEEWQNGRINRNHFNFRKRLQYAWETFNSTRFTGSNQSSQSFNPPR